ncbi:hypothetical protein AB835_13965 [Candidatus Endobugula sertula]|uniref:Uncharacterized protein n=1 Tax=Candidatus Endobugula sertula TaxID=62101 RepID=A0A1D2QLL8_9GAMM|nr:hypothetical protein AB835_13965 [Candidatus Endobugula sertula]
MRERYDFDFIPELMMQSSTATTLDNNNNYQYTKKSSASTTAPIGSLAKAENANSKYEYIYSVTGYIQNEQVTDKSSN